MLLLGIDIGTSFIKVSVVNADTQQCIATAQYPETENEIISLQPGWAEQSPEMWWEHTVKAIRKLNSSKKFNQKILQQLEYHTRCMVLLLLINSKKF